MKPETALQVNARSGFCFFTNLNPSLPACLMHYIPELPDYYFRNTIFSGHIILFSFKFLTFNSNCKTKEKVHC